MKKLIIGSIDESAGKTSIIVGLAKAMELDFGYMKPLGDRLLYRKKRLWDYDAALMTNIFGLKENPENISIGFDHSKLKYMYDEESIKDKLLEMVSNTGRDKDILLVEAGRDLTYGTSVNLDAISLAKHIDGKLLFILSGNEDNIMDDITFVKKYVNMSDVDLEGVIINKVQDVEDFQQNYLNSITEMNINVLGIISHKAELTYFTVEYLYNSLLAKVLAGENNLNNTIKNILVGAMSTDAVLRKPIFQRKDKLIITGGDRSDMILAALDSDTAGVILTNNLLPPSNVISKAAARNIPMLLVNSDTFQTAKQIENLDPLLTKDDTKKVELLEKLIKENIDLDKLKSA